MTQPLATGESNPEIVLKPSPVELDQWPDIDRRSL
jgi:hypothetical protein